MHIGKATFNPINFKLSLSELTLQTSAGEEIGSLVALNAKFAPFSLLRLDLVSNSLYFDRPSVKIVRDKEGNYIFPLLSSPSSQENISEIMDFSDLPFFFSLNNIIVNEGSIVLDDQKVGKSHTMEKIQLSLPTLSNIPYQTDRYIEPKFSAVINGSPLALTGKSDLGGGNAAEGKTNLVCELTDLDLPTYVDYLPFTLPIAIQKGKANGSIELQFDQQAKDSEKLRFLFTLATEALAFSSNDQKAVAETAAMQFSGNYQPVGKLLQLSSLTMKRPVVKLITDTPSEYLAGAFGLTQISAESAMPATQQPTRLEIQRAILDQARIEVYSPKNPKGKPVSLWDPIQFSLLNYSSTTAPGSTPTSEANFSLNAESLSGGAQLSWQGKIPSGKTDSLLSGQLRIDKGDLAQTFAWFGKTGNLSLNGKGDLNGKLSLKKASSGAGSVFLELSDGVLDSDSFKLMDGKNPVLSSKAFKAGGLLLTPEKIQFGTILLREASATFTLGKKPAFLGCFDGEQCGIKAIEYQGSLAMLDNKGEKLLQLSNLTLKANELDQQKTDGKNLSIIAESASKGVLKALGGVQLAPFSGNLKVGFNGFAPGEILPVIASADLGRKLNGNLSGTGTLQLPQQSFSGELRIQNGTFDPMSEGQPTARWNDLLIQDLSYNPSPFALSASRLTLDGLDYHFTMTPGSPNAVIRLNDYVHSLLPTPKNQDQTKGKVRISPLDIAETVLTGATLTIDDQRLTPAWQARITDVNGTLGALSASLTAPACNVALSGNLGEAALNLQGSLKLLAGPLDGSITINLAATPLATFREQLAKQTAIEPDEGIFELETRTSFTAQSVSRIGSLNFLDANARSADAKLALALLSGPVDTFKLDLITEVSPGDPWPSLFEESLSQLQTQVVRASVSPLLLATGDFTDLIGEEHVDFLPGEFMLSEAGRQTLARYSALLIAHPRIGLELIATGDPEKDSQAMRSQLEALERERVEAENARLYKVWQEEKREFEKLLEERRKQQLAVGQIVEQDLADTLFADFVPLQPATISITSEMLNALADRRAQIVQEHFLTQLALEPGRIQIRSDLETTEDLPAIPAVMVFLRVIGL